MERKINPDLIKNVPKYIRWMPDDLVLEIDNEIGLYKQMRDDDGLSHLKWSDDRTGIPFIIASMARKPERANRGAQTGWVWRILDDLNLDTEYIFKDISFSDIKFWDTLNNGWNGAMWMPLVNLFDEGGYEITYDSFIGMENSFVTPYGTTLKNIIFSEGKGDIKFINWMWENPLEVKQ